MLEVAALQQENIRQRDENAALRAQVTQLIESIAKLNERVAELLAVYRLALGPWIRPAQIAGFRS